MIILSKSMIQTKVNSEVNKAGDTRHTKSDVDSSMTEIRKIFLYVQFASWVSTY